MHVAQQLQPRSRARCRGRHAPDTGASRRSHVHIVQVATTDTAHTAPSLDAGGAQCPFRSVASRFQLGQTARVSEYVGSDGIMGVNEIPGPQSFTWQWARDVSTICFSGIHEAMLQFSNNYGPICQFANPSALNGASSWVFLNSPDNIQHVCATNVKNYTRRYLPDIYKYVTHEKGILGSQDDYNARHRRLCQPAFRSKLQLQNFSEVVVARSQRLAVIWREHDDFVTDVATQTQRLTLDIVGLTAFSHDFGQVERINRDLAGQAGDGTLATDRLLWAVNTFGEILAQVFITPLGVLRALERLGLPHLRLLREAVDTMRSSMLDVIQERRAELAAGKPGKTDLLGVLLEAEDDEGRRMSDEELWEDVHDVMGAGHETTATTTAALLYSIAAHSAVNERVQEELQRVLGGRAPTYSDLESLPYLTQCVRETLRLYPAIPVFPREAAADDVLPSGHAVHAGDVVFMSSYALGRSAAIWDDPLVFNPERFSPPAEACHHRFQWLPFGAGPRMCLGATFAQMSVTLMAATLLQQFRFTPVHPTAPLLPVTYDITMNFNATHGLKMRVQPIGT